ncbi:DNA translocase FtsK [Tistlia consotensis]|uniref:DNA translocase FtsK n=1 Tax=Tistlia consotensis USBA 355 TaxID=560819 RepID=A0A1Y6BH02_9PROT|nr:DNA translocase FtsK [Tistlia consotensis]SMF09439.1 DNA translocase FtsK [Tistlia consotensis USBA 355]SNR34528.1 DNA translocase FtsK [Tistlia consotensis]
MSLRESIESGGRGGPTGGRLLPPGSGAFLRRRGAELLGGLLAATGAGLVAACLTYTPGDPSLNRATDAAARNLLGPFGAQIADLALQGLGLAAFLIAICAFAWTWRLWRARGLPSWGLRLAAAVASWLLAAVGLEALPRPDTWSLRSGLGGFVGELALGQAGALSGLATGLIAAVAGLAALLLLLYAVALTGPEWRAIGRGLAWLGLNAGRGAASAGRQLRRSSPAAAVPVKARRRRAPSLLPGGEPDDEEPDDELPPAEPETASPAPAARKPLRGEPTLTVEPRAERVESRKRPAPGKRDKAEAQGSLAFGGAYEAPALSLLAEPKHNADARESRDGLEKNARLLEGVLADFGVRGEIVKVRPGPVVTRYELEPAPGTKTSRVVGLADDIARSMSAVSVRVAVVPGSSTIGIELPNAKRETVYLRELLASADYEESKLKLPLALGKDIGGAPQMVDLARMPHLLVAGTTGSGKSVSVNAMILSLLYRLPPEACRFIMVDPKMLELSVYDGIPHLLSPVVTEPKKAVVALKWAVREMEQRYRSMSLLGVRNIEGYNGRLDEARRTGEVPTRKVQTGFDPDTGQPIHEEQPFDLTPLPYIVVIVDEMADLMLVAGKEVEGAIQRLAQMARAAGIHLIMATQRPSVDVITGTIKANFPTRISFHVTSRIDSRTILGESGAEHLLGMGDMLYMAHGGRIARIHGPFVSDQEVERIVGHLKRQGEPEYIEEVTRDEEEAGGLGFGDDGEGGSGDDLYDRAVAVVAQHRKASTSFIQRQLQIGYNRAARLVERMEAEGVVSEANHVGKREVLLPER